MPLVFIATDYFGSTKFNPKMEMAKETNLREFFIVLIIRQNIIKFQNI